MQEKVAETSVARFTYAVGGSGSPVLLLSGSGGWRLTFETLAKHLSSTHTVYALDPPGLGGTRVKDPTFRYDADAVSDLLTAFLDAVDVEVSAVVGHSWGGGFAARLTERHPHRVSSWRCSRRAASTSPTSGSSA
jgi:pimeloyl-ACP methyl ester carboxylesterase